MELFSMILCGTLVGLVVIVIFLATIWSGVRYKSTRISELESDIKFLMQRTDPDVLRIVVKAEKLVGKEIQHPRYDVFYVYGTSPMRFSNGKSYNFDELRALVEGAETAVHLCNTSRQSPKRGK